MYRTAKSLELVEERFMAGLYYAPISYCTKL